ncbi:MAG: hypothetical protein OIF40_08825, partial [Mangrovicoccus sp.]|nr:hypothetical protein [Mangrovicoccus sp.]
AAICLLGACGGDAFRIAPVASPNLSKTYVGAEYGTAGNDSYREFRSGQIGCPELARRGWSNEDLFAAGCPAY